MSKDPMLTHYVSEIDQFLQSFDLNHAQLSKSQQKEQAKYRRIYLLRDNPNHTDSSKTLWEKF
jgi:hypothetical protein